MHLNWEFLTEQEKLIFVEIQRMFSRETFDPAKITLEKVNLEFYVNTWLVKATIDPHEVSLGNGKTISIDKECESYFLYNPITSEISKKVISLDRKSDTVYIANSILGLKLTKSNVVDYVKFFGLVVSDEPFFFVDSVSEIPWCDNIGDEKKQRLLGAIEAFCPISPSGEMNVGLTENTKMHGKTFDLSIPCIFKDACFCSKMSVAENGLIVMEDDQPLADASVTPVKSQLPYYQVNATRDYIKTVRSKIARRNFAISAMRLIVIISSLPVLLMALVTVVDGVLIALNSDLSSQLNSWLLDKPNLLIFFTLCVAIVVCFSIFRAIIFEYSELIGKDKPHALSMMLGSFSSNLRGKYKTTYARIQGVALMLLIGVVDLLLSASVIMFSIQNSLTDVITNNDALGLGMYPLILLVYFVNIFAIGRISGFFAAYSLSDLEFSLTGEILLVFFSLLLSLVILRSGYRFWRQSKKES